jgi:hypothetical protein
MYSQNPLSVYFTYKNDILETVEEYRYLGISFSRSGCLAKAKHNLAQQATK